jgi:hypothetical protein
MPMYNVIALILRCIAMQMKEVLPCVYDYGKCEKFVKELKKRIDPHLQTVHMQLKYVFKKGTKKYPIYEVYVCALSLYDLTREWDEQWVRILTQLKEGDVFVDVLLQSIFSGPWQQENPGRVIFEPIDDLQFDEIRKIDASSYWTIPVAPPRKKTPPPPGSVYIPSKVLKTIPQTDENTKFEYPNNITYAERSIFFNSTRLLAYRNDFLFGGMFEEIIMREKEIRFCTDNRNGGAYLKDDVNTFQAFKMLAKEQQVQLFQIWKNDPTEKKLIDEITAMVAPMYSGGRGGRNRKS